MLNLRQQQGSATIITIMAVMILASAGGFLVMLTSSNLTTAAEFQNAATAQYAAEAGAKAAAAMFAASVPDWDALNVETEVLGVVGAYYKAQTEPLLTGAQLPAPGEDYQVVATGRYRKAVRIVSFTVSASGTPAVSNWR